MKLPIIAFCDGYISVFPTVEFAEGYIEPIDVENGEWQVFDAEGQRLRITVENESTHGLWAIFSRYTQVVQISEFSPQLVEEEVLRNLIIKYGERPIQKPEVSRETLESMPLKQLVTTISHLTLP